MVHIQLNMHLIIYSKHLCNYSLEEIKEKTPLEAFNTGEDLNCGWTALSLAQRPSESPKNLRVCQPRSLTCIFEVTHVSCLKRV